MRRKKSFEEHVAWYIDAVKSYLIIRAGFLSEAAEKAVVMYRLRDKLMECPDIALHDDPKTIAKEIQERDDIVRSCAV